VLSCLFGGSVYNLERLVVDIPVLLFPVRLRTRLSIKDDSIVLYIQLIRRALAINTFKALAQICEKRVSFFVPVCLSLLPFICPSLRPHRTTRLPPIGSS
jgi:hypothetical protein